jgi:hypothetical protein
MTKQFDTLLEQMLSEMVPADIGEIGFGGAVKELKKGVPEGEPKGHWAPLQKLSAEDQEKVIEEILKEIFSEKENTYAPTVDDQEQLKDSIKSAIQTVSGRTGLKAAGNWAAKFLSDRLFTLLKNKVNYTTSGGEEVQKDMTQKDFKQALKKALEEAPEEKPETTEEEVSSEQKEVETVYMKAADLDSDDADLQKAFKKLPDNKEMSWEEVLKTIGMTKGMALLDAGGLTETEKEKETSEEEEVKELDIDDEDSADLSKFDKFIDPYFSTTRRAGGPLGWD